MKNLKKFAFALAALSFLGLVSCNSNEDNALKTSDPQVTDSHAIINGEPDTEWIHRAVVSLFLSHPDYDEQSICTGTLIHPQWVLTAAHCVSEVKIDKPYPSKFSSYLSIAVGNNTDELKEHRYDIADIYFHEKYDSNINNDIALIKLSAPIPESVAFPIPPHTSKDVITRKIIESEGVPMTIVGFGYNEEGAYGIKRKFDSRISSYCGAFDNDSINGCYQGEYTVNGCHPKGYPCYNDYVTSVTIPFGSLFHEYNPGGQAPGDSGGPAFVTTKDYPWIAVAGLTSWSDPARTTYGVYTAVQDFYDSFILTTAPEVKTYNEERLARAQHEIESGECGDELHALCDLLNEKVGSPCTIHEDKTLSCEEDESTEPEPGEVDPTSCQTYDGLTVKNGEEGCYNEMVLATCNNGQWVDMELCGTDQNAIATCYQNECKVKCNDGFERAMFDNVCISIEYGDSCVNEDEFEISDEYEDDWAYEHGQYTCESGYRLIQCVNGEWDYDNAIYCSCNGGNHRTEHGCDLEACELNGKEYYSTGTYMSKLVNKCIDDNTVATCFDGEWVNRIACPNGCSDGVCVE